MAKWLAIAGALASVAPAACTSGPEPLSVDHAWVRLSAVPGRPAAAYFTIHGGAAPATLIGVTTDVTIRTEMHASMTAPGGMTMRPLAEVPVPAGTDVPFAPGGRHVMLFDVNRGIVPGATMILTLTFADGTRIQRKANVVGAGG